MVGITIRRPEKRVKLKLRTRAAANAESMEEVARQILRSTSDQVSTHTDQKMDSVVGFRLANDVS